MQSKIIAIVAAAAMMAALALTGCSGVSQTPSEPSASSSAPGASDTKKPNPEPKLTKAQKQAVGKANDYLDGGMHFSRAGLIKQLKFEGFTQAQAAYGVKKAGL